MSSPFTLTLSVVLTAAGLACATAGGASTGVRVLGAAGVLTGLALAALALTEDRPWR